MEAGGDDGGDDRSISFIPTFDNSVCSLGFFPLVSSASFSFGGDGWVRGVDWLIEAVVLFLKGISRSFFSFSVFFRGRWSGRSPGTCRSGSGLFVAKPIQLSS